MLNELFGKFDQIAKVRGGLPPYPGPFKCSTLESPFQGKLLTPKIPVPFQSPCIPMEDIPMEVGNPLKQPQVWSCSPHISNLERLLNISTDASTTTPPNVLRTPSVGACGHYTESREIFICFNLREPFQGKSLPCTTSAQLSPATCSDPRDAPNKPNFGCPPENLSLEGIFMCSNLNTPYTCQSWGRPTDLSQPHIKLRESLDLTESPNCKILQEYHICSHFSQLPSASSDL